MSTSQVLTIAVGVCTLVLAAGCSTGAEKPFSWDDWNESQHPPSDTAPLPEGCKSVKYRGSLIPIVEYVKGPGHYCVVHDFVQRARIDLIDRTTRRSDPGDSGVLRILSGDHVDLDLRGHLISGAPFDDTVGVLLAVGRRGEEKNNFLRVHSGTVVTPGLLGVGVLAAPYKNPKVNTPVQADEPPMRQSRYDSASKTYIFSDPWNYEPATHYAVENLTIRSGGRGIIMSGADNVVRNNVIEVDGKVAVYMYGPRPVIEGNTFIVKLDSKDKAQLPAALKLLDADGAIIRNNRFIVQSTGFGRGKAEVAINLLNSKDVLIENNTIEDTKQLVRKDDSSSVMERGNQIR